MKHQYIIHAKQEVPETWMATAILECKRVVNGYVTAIRSAGVVDMHITGKTQRD